jgi:hypothetical protein
MWMAVVVAVAALTARTHLRNQDWQSEVRIYEAGMQLRRDSL